MRLDALANHLGYIADENSLHGLISSADHHCKFCTHNGISNPTEKAAVPDDQAEFKDKAVILIQPVFQFKFVLPIFR